MRTARWGEQRLAEPDIGGSQLLVVAGQRAACGGNSPKQDADSDEPKNRLRGDAGQDGQPIGAVSPKLRRRQQQIGTHNGKDSYSTGPGR
jgi:hypothetical protein